MTAQSSIKRKVESNCDKEKTLHIMMQRPLPLIVLSLLSSEWANSQEAADAVMLMTMVTEEETRSTQDAQRIEKGRLGLSVTTKLKHH